MSGLPEIYGLHGLKVLKCQRTSNAFCAGANDRDQNPTKTNLTDKSRKLEDNQIILRSCICSQEEFRKPQKTKAI